MEIFWFKKVVAGVCSHMIIDKRREGRLVSEGYQSHGLEDGKFQKDCHE